MKNSKIYVVSRFEGRNNEYNKFHFIGYFKGIKIRKIFVEGGGFTLNKEYILALGQIRINEDHLTGTLISFKLIG